MPRAVQQIHRRRAALVGEPAGVPSVRLPVADRTWLPAALTVTYLAACAALLPFHEMWRDEVQAWLIARDTSSIADLYSVLKHEGHPGLWHVCLKLMNLLTGSPAAMQAFHVGTAAATVLVFARYSPFSNLQKSLFAFGYFPFYEYALVSRNYALSVLLLFGFCALYRRRHERPWSVGIVVFLLANTNVLGLIVSIVLLALLVHDGPGWRGGRRGSWVPWPADAWRPDERGAGRDGGTSRAALLFMASGVLLSFLQLLPGPHTGLSSVPPPTIGGTVPTALVNGFVPAVGPALRLSSHADVGRWIYPPLAFAVVAFLLWHAVRIREHAFALAFLLAATLGLLLFFHGVFAGQPRHHGLLFFVFLSSVWLAADAAARSADRASPVARAGGDRRFANALTFVLLTQALGGMAAAAADVRYTFSHARNVAEFLQERNLEDEAIVAYPDAPVSTVLGYLPVRSFYYPQIDGHGSFVRWTRERAQTLSAVEVLCAGRSLSRDLGRDVVLIGTPALDLAGRDAARLIADADVDLLAGFSGALVPSENYRVYRIARPRGRSHALCARPPSELVGSERRGVRAPAPEPRSGRFGSRPGAAELSVPGAGASDIALQEMPHRALVSVERGGQ